MEEGKRAGFPGRGQRPRPRNGQAVRDPVPFGRSNGGAKPPTEVLVPGRSGSSASRPSSQMVTTSVARIKSMPDKIVVGDRSSTQVSSVGLGSKQSRNGPAVTALSAPSSSSTRSQEKGVPAGKARDAIGGKQESGDKKGHRSRGRAGRGGKPLIKAENVVPQIRDPNFFPELARSADGNSEREVLAAPARENSSFYKVALVGLKIPSSDEEIQRAGLQSQATQMVNPGAQQEFGAQDAYFSHDQAVGRPGSVNALADCFPSQLSPQQLSSTNGTPASQIPQGQAIRDPASDFSSLLGMLLPGARSLLPLQSATDMDEKAQQQGSTLQLEQLEWYAQQNGGHRQSGTDAASVIGFQGNPANVLQSVQLPAQLTMGGHMNNATSKVGRAEVSCQGFQRNDSVALQRGSVHEQDLGLGFGLHDGGGQENWEVPRQVLRNPTDDLVPTALDDAVTALWLSNHQADRAQCQLGPIGRPCGITPSPRKTPTPSSFSRAPEKPAWASAERDCVRQDVSRSPVIGKAGHADTSPWWHDQLPPTIGEQVCSGMTGPLAGSIEPQVAQLQQYQAASPFERKGPSFAANGLDSYSQHRYLETPSIRGQQGPTVAPFPFNVSAVQAQNAGHSLPAQNVHMLDSDAAFSADEGFRSSIQQHFESSLESLVTPDSTHQSGERGSVDRKQSRLLSVMGRQVEACPSFNSEVKGATGLESGRRFGHQTYSWIGAEQPDVREHVAMGRWLVQPQPSTETFPPAADSSLSGQWDARSCQLVGPRQFTEGWTHDGQEHGVYLGAAHHAALMMSKDSVDAAAEGGEAARKEGTEDLPPIGQGLSSTLSSKAANELFDVNAFLGTAGSASSNQPSKSDQQEEWPVLRAKGPESSLQPGGSLQPAGGPATGGYNVPAWQSATWLDHRRRSRVLAPPPVPDGSGNLVQHVAQGSSWPGHCEDGWESESKLRAMTPGGGSSDSETRPSIGSAFELERRGNEKSTGPDAEPSLNAAQMEEAQFAADIQMALIASLQEMEERKAFEAEVKDVEGCQASMISTPTSRPTGAGLLGPGPGARQTLPPQPLQKGSVVVGRGLANRQGQYNCFLNVVIQCLWHLEAFRAGLLALWQQPALHSGTGSGVLQALGRIFHALSARDGSPSAVDPAQLRAALSEASTGSDLFQLEEMGDASEVLGFIYHCLHQVQEQQQSPARPRPTQLPNSPLSSPLPRHATPHIDQNSCTGPCLVHRLFGLDLRESMDCKLCGHETHVLRYQECFHLFNCSALCEARAEFPEAGFGALLGAVVARSVPQRPCDADQGGCGALTETAHRLARAPSVFTAVLVWGAVEAQLDTIITVAQAIETKVDVSKVFPGLPFLGLHRLCCVVCYYGFHYAAFVYSSQLRHWLLCDDTTVKVVGGWDQVERHCRLGRLQPSVLFYQARSAVRTY